MNTTDIARQFDACEQPVEAANAYERAIDSGEQSIEAFIDLAVLYWVCTDGGYLAHHHLSQEFVDRADRRAREVLDEAARRFGPNAEIAFWQYYFDHISYGKPSDASFCEALLESGESLVPSFHLYCLTGKATHRQRCEALRSAAKNRRTERERYLWSVADSALRS